MKKSRPLVRIIRLEEERRLNAAPGQQSIAPPCVAVHWSDASRAAMERQFFACGIERFFRSRLVDGGEMAHDSRTLPAHRRWAIPPERCPRNHHAVTHDHDMRVAAVPCALLDCERRQRRVRRKADRLEFVYRKDFDHGSSRLMRPNANADAVAE